MITNTACEVHYTGDGAHTNYSVPFRFLANSDLVVTWREAGTAVEAEEVLVLDTDYTVAGAGATNGGSITLTDTLEYLDVIAIKRIMPITQTWDVRNQGAYHPERTENAQDKLTMICQQLAQKLGGVMQLPDTVDPDTVDMVLPVPSNGTLIAWNATGTGLENVTLGDGDALSLPDDYGIAVYAAANTFTHRTLTAGEGISITNGTGVSGNPTVATTYPPTGSILMYGAASAPSGFLLCDGSAVSRTTYAALFAVIGTTYGVGNGTTTFNVPGGEGRFPLGAGTEVGGSTLYSLGNEGGEASHTLLTTELPSHSHTVLYIAGSHANGSESCNEVMAGGDTSMSTSAVGGGVAMAMMPPWFCVNFIIKT